MNNNRKEQDNYGTNPRNFSGLIFTSDFNTEYKKNNYSGSPIASRIQSDWRFDKYLDNLKERRKQYENR